VQERADGLHLHPLAERQLPQLHREPVRDVEPLGMLAQAPLEVVAVDRVDLLEQSERVDRRDVPPQLRALAHHQRELALLRVAEPEAVAA